MPGRPRKRVQTWPIRFVDQATIIESQNERLILGLLICYRELKLAHIDELKEELPKLKERLKRVYQAAVKVTGSFQHKQPTWFDVCQRIKNLYPDTCTKLIAAERKLGRGLLKQVREDLIYIINDVADVHADILRIPIPKKPDADAGAELTILDINNLNLIRNLDEFKLPDDNDY